MLLGVLVLLTVYSEGVIWEMRRVQVTGLSGEKIDFPSDSLVVVDGVDEDKDDAGVAKAGSSVATPL